jgi:hypothetical protein
MLQPLKASHGPMEEVLRSRSNGGSPKIPEVCKLACNNFYRCFKLFFLFYVQLYFHSLLCLFSGICVINSHIHKHVRVTWPFNFVKREI